GSGVELTNEMLASSNVEALAQDALTRAVALTLDTKLFDDQPGDGIRPAGLRNGIATSTASTATDTTEAMFADLETIIRAVAPVAGGGQIAIVADAARAASISMRVPGAAPTILPSGGVAPDMLIAVATSALASATGGVEIASSKQTHLHESDTPSTVLWAPSRSLFQTDASAMKVRLETSWAVRDPTAVAWLQTNW